MTRRWPSAGLPVTLVAVVSLVPVYMIAVESVKGIPEEVHGNPWLAVRPTLQWYGELLHLRGRVSPEPFARPFPGILWLRNTAVVLATAVSLTVLLGTGAAYALVRLRPPGGRAIGRALLAAALIPQPMLVLPLQHLAFRLHWDDHLAGVAAVDAIVGLPYCVWILSRRFRRFPREWEDAAVLEGASHVWILRRLVLPVSVPALALAATVALGVAGGDVVLASVLLSARDHQTLGAGLAAMDVSMDDLAVLAAVNLSALLVVPVTLVVGRAALAGKTPVWDDVTGSAERGAVS